MIPPDLANNDNDARNPVTCNKQKKGIHCPVLIGGPETGNTNPAGTTQPPVGPPSLERI
ncbi:5296_t:CDS:2 [Paraglomus occultum]|uniref:5296_t:CDS:1 n=1 Tax=Paraglomus occultum TaxID=144539 RepID=A0A9N9B0G3_9GLOM|nr:5296_t:CDS:2 [Paraglomus occultum]